MREDHKHIVPELDGLSGEPRHSVACLPTDAQRTGLWAGLKAGATPEEAPQTGRPAGGGACPRPSQAG